MSPNASEARGYTANMESRCDDVRWSLLQLRGPVLHELERFIGGLPALLRWQGREDAALGGDIVANTHAGGREPEEPVRLADVQRRPLGAHRHGHEEVVTADIKDLLALRRPARRGPAGRRNTALAAGARERRHPDLHVPGFIGLIRHPFPVRGKHRLHFRERRLQPWIWLCRRAGLLCHWEYPDVGRRLRV